MKRALTFIFLLLFFVACQKAQLAEYKKYADDNEVPRISIEDARKDADAGIAVIVDSRPESAYKGEHIAGSINIALGAPDDAFASLPKNKRIIVYCS